jgi:hypothetical protein
MPIESAYVLVVSMDVERGHEDEFNEVYDSEHIPYLLEVPGVRAARRMKGEAFSMSLGGEIKEMPTPRPVWSAVYEIDSPDVLTSDAWKEAVERGRWPSVRPYTSNRSAAVYKVR